VPYPRPRRLRRLPRGKPSRAAPGIDLDQPGLAPAQTQFGVLDPVDGRVAQRGPTDDLDVGGRAKTQLPQSAATTDDAAAATPTMVARCPGASWASTVGEPEKSLPLRRKFASDKDSARGKANLTFAGIPRPPS